MRLLYSDDALRDLIRLRDFIAQNSPDAATRIAEALLYRIEVLCNYPEMGRPVAHAPQPDTIRDMIFGNHVVRYMPRADTLIILRIWHHLENRDLT